MSVQEVRNMIIRENLPRLLKGLTGFNESDENYNRCQQFALSTLRIHRTISTNSHEIRRKVDAMKEKFQFDNLYDEAVVLGELCEEIINHPLCISHYELDIQWSLIDMLLSLAFNPAGFLKKNLNKEIFKVNQRKDEEPETVDMEYWVKLLKEDVAPSFDSSNLTNDELSDWSEEESNVSFDLIKDGMENKESGSSKQIMKVKQTKIFEPPSRELSYEVVEYDRNLVNKSFQERWWCTRTSGELLDCRRLVANFAVIFNKYMNEKYFQLERRIEISSEYSLIREILWMFHKPLDCKFFKWDDKIFHCRENVTIASVSSDVLMDFVETNFIPYIKMMNDLTSFLDYLKNSREGQMGKTFECYGATLRNLLKPIWDQIGEIEIKMMYPDENFIATIINLQYCLRPILFILKAIHSIHQRIVLDMKKHPPYILSTFMLTELMNIMNVNAIPSETNLAGYIFLTVIKICCQILDSWWSQGCINDPNGEFFAQSIKEESNGLIVIRPLSGKIGKKEENSIKKNRLYCLLTEHCLEAGSLLKMLYNINRVSELKKVTGAIIGSLYETFLEDLQHYIQSLIQPTIERNTIVKTNEELSTSCSGYSSLDKLCIDDEYLSLVFHSKDSNDTPRNANYTEASSETIYSMLEESKVFIPLEEIILKILKNMLRKRITLADAFVSELMLKEFALPKHLKNLRLVLLLEASDLMYQFYKELFKKIEAKSNWANSYLLTSNLNDLLCSRYADMNALFSMEVRSNIIHKTEKVCHAVEDISIKYNVPRELSYIITSQAIEDYNKIFQFLLKVKWSLIALENMNFVNSPKRCMIFEIGELLMRRLEHLRFWMLHDLQTVHFHLTTNVLEVMTHQLEDSLLKCKNFKQIMNAHKTYLDTIIMRCCLTPNLSSIKLGIEQLINLVLILRLEWKSCVNHMLNSDPLSITLDDSFLEQQTNYISINQVDEIEHTFIRCHQYLANYLNKEVYIKQNDFLSGLSSAFNASLPY